MNKDMINNQQQFDNIDPRQQQMFFQQQQQKQNLINNRMLPNPQMMPNKNIQNNKYPPQQQQIQQVPQNPFLQDIIKILNSKDENKNEILGEAIFYYLLKFIEKHNINTTNYENEKLCSRFTGIFINSSHLDLIEIFKYEEVLMKTLKEIIQELQKFPISDN